MTVSDKLNLHLYGNQPNIGMAEHWNKWVSYKIFVLFYKTCVQRMFNYHLSNQNFCMYGLL